MSYKPVLVLDDSSDISKVVSMFLQSESIPCTTVPDGWPGVEAVRKANEQGNPYGLFISDVQMPYLSGPGFYKRINEEGLDNKTPIIFMTGGLYAGDMQDILRIEPFAIVPKPVDYPPLLEFAKKALAGEPKPDQDIVRILDRLVIKQRVTPGE